MPRLFSASVDEALPSTEILCAKEAYLNRLSHAASAIELRATRRSNAHSAGPRKRKGRRFLRAVSSFPLSETTHNARKDVSRSSNSNSEDRFSMCMTDYDGSCSSTSDLETDTAAKNYPSPPASDDGSPSEPSKESHASQPVDTFPFPLNPVPISVSSKFVGSRNDVLQTPTRRRTSAELSYRTPSRSPDRFISNRQSPQDPAKTFRLSKSPKRLSSLERLRRHKSATPDPFDPLNVRRLREGRIALPVYGNAHATTSRSRTIGTTSVSHPPQDPLATQNRQASAGAVWNVGGNALADHSHPIRNVSDGRGGFISSGSNAPMYSSHFLDDDTMEDDTNQMESRLAAALDIDQITKVLDISRGPNPSRTLSTSSFGKKRRYSYVEPRTRWIQGEWVKERSQSREHTFLSLQIQFIPMHAA